MNSVLPRSKRVGLIRAAKMHEYLISLRSAYKLRPEVLPYSALNAVEIRKNNVRFLPHITYRKWRMLSACVNGAWHTLDIHCRACLGLFEDATAKK